MLHRCEHCGVIKTTFRRYTKHLRHFHESDANFHVTCNISGCKDTFKVVRCFVRHVSRKHQHVSTECSLASGIVDTECPDLLENEEIDTNEMCMTVAENTDFTRTSVEQNVNIFNKHVTQCMLKLKEKHILTATVQQDIVNQMHSLVSEIHETYSSSFKSFCNDQHVSPNSSDVGDILLRDVSVFEDIFKQIDTDYKLNKTIQSHFTFVKPSMMVLADNQQGKPAVFSYVSVTSVLKLVLGNNDVRCHVLSCMNAVPCDRMSSYIDGSAYQENSFFVEHPQALRLHFYLDEFDVCNPIGAKRGKHKVLAVYYLIGNLDCKYWSEMKYIHLCSLVRYNYLRDYDPHYEKFLKPLVDELNVLATEGFDIAADGVTHHFVAGLATISADNLSAHSVAGFQRHFNSGRICRHCMANHDEIGQSFNEEHYHVRSKAVHAYHLEALQSSVANGPIYGVMHRCPLLDVSYFDVTTAFVPDIMHDILEGVIPQLLSMLIRRAVRERKVTLDVLNSRLEETCKNASDRPNLFSAKLLTPLGKISGSASQKWQLFLVMPQILGRYLDENDESWQVYLLLRHVTDLVFAPVIAKSCLSYLSGLISQFLTCFTSVFGTDAVTPKHHYMIHYPRLISVYGPLRHLWCMRFEAKHQYFKSVISSLGNYINVACTMANRHQMRQCWEFSGSDVLHCEPYPLSKTKVFPISQLPADIRSAVASRLSIEVDLNDSITTTDNLKYDHVTYTVGACMLLCTVEAEDVPVYFIVKYILLFCSCWLLCGRLCFCQQFDRDLHAFSVNVDDSWAVVHPGEELDYSMHDFFVVDGTCYVSSKYHLSSVHD